MKLRIADLRFAMKNERPTGELLIGVMAAGHAKLVLGLLAFALVQGLVSITGRDLIGEDDVRVAGIARDLVLRGNYAVPYLNGERFLLWLSSLCRRAWLMSLWRNVPSGCVASSIGAPFAATTRF